MSRTVDQRRDLPQRLGLVDQRPHAQTSGDEKGVEALPVVREGVGQGKGGEDADAVSDGGFQTVRGIRVVDVDELEGVVIAAGDDGAEGTEEIERFEVGVDEGEDAVLRGHFFCDENCRERVRN